MGSVSSPRFGSYFEKDTAKGQDVFQLVLHEPLLVGLSDLGIERINESEFKPIPLRSETYLAEVSRRYGLLFDVVCFLFSYYFVKQNRCALMR